MNTSLSNVLTEAQAMVDREARGTHIQACSPRRVLLADDNLVILGLLKHMVSSSVPDIEIDSAANGLEALSAFRDAHHAVVVTDVDMPVMDGCKAFEEIRKLCEDREWQMPSVVFCTASTLPEALRCMLASESCPHRLLMKPFGKDEFVRAVVERLAPAA